MRTVIQRVRSASVSVEGRIVSKISRGLLVLTGIERGDDEVRVATQASKIRQLRIFADDSGRMNRSVEEVGGEILAVSQFTLAGSLEKGRRPSFGQAEDPAVAEPLFNRFVDSLGEGGTAVSTGVFGAMMLVTLENDGPVTFLIET